MKVSTRFGLVASVALILAGSGWSVIAQQQPAPPPQPPQAPNMTFLVVGNGPGKGADLGGEGDRLILDFNYAYNPSCAYDPRWSCPLAPAANWLQVPIRAGERYTTHE